jgi:hypothetical protein
MIKKHLRAASAGAAACVLGVLATAGSAQAALYRGNWDPTYGGIFPALGWEATALFDVPGACLGLSDGTHLGSACPGFSVLSAELDFYNAANDPNPATSPIVESFALDTHVFINGFEVTHGALTGVNTIFPAVIPAAGSLGIAGNGNYSFSLVLSGHDAQLAFVTPASSPPFCNIPGDRSTCGLSENVAFGTITAVVPEPETYALMLAGLAVLGSVARRRKA